MMTVAKKKKKIRTGEPLHVWLPKPLLEAFEALRKTTRRTKTTEVEVMMEDYLTRHGFWPPASHTQPKPKSDND